jgi:hypothetical protein
MSKLRAKYPTHGEFLRKGCIAALAICYLGVGSNVGASPGEDPPATHNMLVIGEKAVFLSHLPMFGASDPTKDDFSPHRFQVILEATFTDRNKPRICISFLNVRKHGSHEGFRDQIGSPFRTSGRRGVSSSGSRRLGFNCNAILCDRI